MDTHFSGYEKVGLAPSIDGHFRPWAKSSIANCASTPVELICRDIVSQHYREFDQELSGGSRFSYRFRFFLCQPLIEGLQLHVIASSDLRCLSELKAKQRRAG